MRFDWQQHKKARFHKESGSKQESLSEVRALVLYLQGSGNCARGLIVVDQWLHDEAFPFHRTIHEHKKYLHYDTTLSHFLVKVISIRVTNFMDRRTFAIALTCLVLGCTEGQWVKEGVDPETAKRDYGERQTWGSFQQP